MEIGQVFKNVQCEDLTTEFVGICFVDGKKVFVADFFPGETADIVIIEKKSKFIRAEVQTLHNVSSMRAGSLQEEYPGEFLGGCDLQALNYEAQLYLKKQMVEKIAKLTTRQDDYFTFSDVIASPKEINYRNRSHYHLYLDDETGEIKAGFYEKGTKNPQEVTMDVLADRRIFLTLQTVIKALNKYNIAIYDRAEGQQGLRAVMLQYSELLEKIWVTFVSSTADVRDIRRAAEELTQKNGRIRGTLLNINTKHKGAVLGNHTVLLAGKMAITDEMLNVTFKRDATAFYQVNSGQTANIYKKVISLLQDNKDATLLDFYCGIGTMSLLLAPHVKEVIGVDIVSEAIEAAEANAERNNVTNADFFTEDVDVFMNNYKKAPADKLVALLDPPRSGCTETFITNLIELNPEKIVYVSCNPKTLVRDLLVFETQGYKVCDTIELYDMFPQTLHVESITVLEKA